MGDFQPVKEAKNFNRETSRSHAKKTSLFVRVISCVFVICFAALAPAQEIPANAQQVEGLRLPLRRHANGNVEVFLTAERAWMHGDTISAEGDIRVLMMSENGSTNGIARAVKGTFDRANMKAVCVGNVSLEKDSVRIFGENLNWDAEKFTVTINTNAVLVINGF